MVLEPGSTSLAYLLHDSLALNYLRFTPFMYDHIDITEEVGIATITLNRPEKLNALAGHMRRDLAEALEHAGSDPEVRVVVLTGAGRAFCTGADVRRMSELMERDEVEEFKRLLGAGRRV